MADYQEADPAARRRLVVVLLITTIVGAGVIYYYSELLEDSVNDPALAFERLRQIVNSLYVLVIPALWFAFRMWRIARLTNEADRYPPPGIAVVRDTRIVTGNAARRRAFSARVLALLIPVTSILLPTVLLMLVAAFEERLDAISATGDEPVAGAVTLWAGQPGDEMPARTQSCPRRDS